jgi:hypothetical protein
MKVLRAVEQAVAALTAVPQGNRVESYGRHGGTAAAERQSVDGHND